MRKKASLWSLFSLSAAFGRRVAFASLVILALVGSFLVSQERNYDSGSTQGPEAIIASHAPQGESDRDHMMLALASYEQ